MVDQNKRKTLKTIVVASGSIAGGMSISAASAAMFAAGDADSGSVTDYQELGQIEVSTRVSVINNDLELVLRNAGDEAVTITHMTPSVARVARGEFDIAMLLDNGPLRLDAGESVSVALQHKGVSVADVATPTLKEVLGKTMSVVTDANSFASVSIASAVGVAA